MQVFSGIGGVCSDDVCLLAGVLVVSHLCFGGCWRFGGNLAVCPSVSTVFRDVSGLAYVFVVFRWRRRNGIFWAKMAHLSIPNRRQPRCDTLLLLLGLYAGLI